MITIVNNYVLFHLISLYYSAAAAWTENGMNHIKIKSVEQYNKGKDGNYTVGQQRWRTAVSHLPTWRPPKEANKATPGLVFHNRPTLTKVYTQFDMGKKNSVPENRDLQSLNFVTRTLCIFGGRWRTRFQNNA